MKNIWKITGRILAYLSWPLVYVVIMFTTRSKVLIVCGDEVLILQGWLSTGQWGLPGGGVHRHETAIQAAVRETQEETGIVLESTQLNNIGPYRQTSGGRYRFQGFYVELADKPALRLRFFEITGAQWIKIKELKEIRLEQHVKILIDTWQTQR